MFDFLSPPLHAFLFTPYYVQHTHHKGEANRPFSSISEEVPHRPARRLSVQKPTQGLNILRPIPAQFRSLRPLSHVRASQAFQHLPLAVRRLEACTGPSKLPRPSHSTLGGGGRLRGVHHCCFITIFRQKICTCRAFLPFTSKFWTGDTHASLVVCFRPIFVPHFRRCRYQTTITGFVIWSTVPRLDSSDSLTLHSSSSFL